MVNNVLQNDVKVSVNLLSKKDIDNLCQSLKGDQHKKLKFPN